MIKITVASGNARELVGKASGKKFRVQTGYAHTTDRDGVMPPFPDKFDFFLDDDAQPYPAGDYTLHPSALYVNREGQLAIAPRLAPVKKADAPAR
jgi:hypothetical protein